MIHNSFNFTCKSTYMKSRLIFLSAIVALAMIYSCGKEQYFKSESSVKKNLKGTWDLIPIPKYMTVDTGGGSYQKERFENWVFDDNTVTITNNNGSGETGNSTYSVHTSWTKAFVTVDGVPQPLTAEHYNGEWQIVRLDNEIMAIANDHDGSTGLTQLEFKKRN
jgi:hypothetical protein